MVIWYLYLNVFGQKSRFENISFSNFIPICFLGCDLWVEKSLYGPPALPPHPLYFIHADIYFLHFIFGIFYIWYLQLSRFSPLIRLWYLVLFIVENYFEAQPDHEIIRALTSLMDLSTVMMVQLDFLKSSLMSLEPKTMCTLN